MSYKFIEIGDATATCQICCFTRASCACDSKRLAECGDGQRGYYVKDALQTFGDMIEESSALDTQIGGGHYKKYEIEPIEFIIRNQIKGAEASIIKYACRHEDKNGAEDVRKIIHYGMLLLEFKYGEKWEDI